MSFARKLDYGQAGESLITKWLRSRGNSVLPVYEVSKELSRFSGPRLFLPKDSLVVPDLFVFNNRLAHWIEVKHKTAFTWHRNTGCWCTGIDLHHYLDYLRINDETPWPVFLMFLHENGTAKDSPDGSPTGLFGNSLNVLRSREHHRHQNHGRHGMVYWDPSAFARLATLDEVNSVAAAFSTNPPRLCPPPSQRRLPPPPRTKP